MPLATYEDLMNEMWCRPPCCRKRIRGYMVYQVPPDMQTKLAQLDSHPQAAEIKRKLGIKNLADIDWFCQECFWRFIRSHKFLGKKRIMSPSAILQALGADQSTINAWQNYRSGDTDLI